MYILSLLLHLLSIVGGFYMATLILPDYNKINMDEEELLEQEMIEHCKRHMFTTMYLDELELLPDSSNCVINKKDIITLDIPFLNNTIIMFYDSDKEAFCYYTKGDVIYKYLNVACRKYVIEYNCKHLYLDGESKIVKNLETIKENSMFIKKVERQLLHKETNKFILCGSLDDYYKSLIVTEDNDIDIIDFLSFKDSYHLKHS
jgi:hypothetical protein